MEISLTEYMVLIDCLTGSLNIADGGNIYNYTLETRKKIWEVLHERGGSCKTIEITIEQGKANE